jgi:signal transduction histidine kinase
MKKDRESLEQRYQTALTSFFNRDEEKGLYEVSTLGKELVVARMGPDVLLDIHSACLRRLVDSRDPVTISKMVVNANEVLLSGIMAYAMNYYSYIDLLERMQNELQEKALKLEEANRQLQEMDRMKTMFIVTMNHELRTPLNSIIGFSRIILDEWIGPLNDEQKENLSIILNSGRHLLSLINEIIDVSKVEAGKLETSAEDFDLAELVREGVTTVTREAADKGLSLEIESEPLPLHTDRRRLLQALLNLLSNAIKFTERGTICVCARSFGDDHATVSVTDSGPGIPEEARGKLFTPFSRLQADDSNIPGTGLGLYLTRKLMTEVLGGEVTYEDGGNGEGSTFTLRFPVRLEGADKK